MILEIGEKIPNTIIDTVVDGLSGYFFEEGMLFVLKSEDLNDEEIKLFCSSLMSFDLLKLDLYKKYIGNVYAFSILIDGFIDNSEIMFDFRDEAINTISRDKINVKFILSDEEDTILSLREFKFNDIFSNIIIKSAKEQISDGIRYTEKNIDYVTETFKKIFENEPEKNIELYSIGKDIIK